MRLLLISLFLISFYTKNTIAQIGYMDSMMLVSSNNIDSIQFLLKKYRHLDSLHNELKSTNLENHKLNKIFNEFDSLAMNNNLTHTDYREVSIFILENEVEEGYPFILKHATQFRIPSIYSAAGMQSAMKHGDFSILHRILLNQLSGQNKAFIFREYILSSGYLGNELSSDEIIVIGRILGRDYSIFLTKLENSRNVEKDNIDKIKKFMSGN